MANNNDFLSQFSNENYNKTSKPEEKQTLKETKIEPVSRQEKPASIKTVPIKKTERIDSFKEEKRVKVQKEPINPLFIIIPSVVALIITAILIYIFVFPHIVVPNFIGNTKEDVSAWIKQQGIETQGIILKEEYNFDAPIGQVLSQTPETGKVKKNAKMTFVVSKGADPNESVSVPDLENMTKSDIESWIKNNKLANTKISTAYNNEVEEGKVISLAYGNGVDSSNFTRGDTLKISISKGPKPAEQITVENFVKQSYTSVETWAEKNKINLTKTEVYSDTVDSGLVISQSLEANKKINQGDSFSIVVSKGKGILVPTFATMTSSQIDDWIEENGKYLKINKKYSNSGEYVLEQSIKSGNYIGSDKTLELTISLGNGFYLTDVFPSYNSGSYDKFKEWADNKASDLGLYIDTHRISKESKEVKGTILGIESIKSGSNTYSEIEKLPLSVDVYVYVSNGNNPEIPEESTTFPLSASDADDLKNKNYAHFVNWCNDKGANISSIKIIIADEENQIQDTSDIKMYDIDYFYAKDSYGNVIKYFIGSTDIDVPKGATLILKEPQ